MASHFFCVCASKADRAILFVANSEHETVRNTINDPVCAISGLAIIETIISDDRENIEIDPARERYAML
jgi:hypothetical protein